MEIGLGAELGPSHAHLGLVEGPKNVDHFVAPYRWPMTTHKQHLILVCTSVPPKRLQKHTQWSASGNIRAGSHCFKSDYLKDYISRYQTIQRPVLLGVVST